MGKVLIAIMICLVFVAQGCAAFKDHYNATSDEVSTSTTVPGGENGSGGGDVDVATDYSSDTTKCKPNLAVSAVLISDQEDFANAGWTTESGEATVVASKLGDFTTAISISNDSGTLSYTIKQVGSESFDVCDILYESCVGECFGVKSLWSNVTEAMVDIYQFNREDGTLVVNAGHYNITFAESSMGDAGTTLEGSYLTDVLEGAVAE